MVKNNLRIGIDIGGTKVLGILIDNDNNILKRIKIQTPKKSKEEFYDKVGELIKKLELSGKARVGVGICGAVDDKGYLTSVPNIPILNKTNAIKEIEKRVDKKVNIDNDANCFAKSLQFYESGENAVGVIIGTGIGSGVIINNMVYKGSTGRAGEIGHGKIFDGLEFEDLLGGKSMNSHNLNENQKTMWHENLAKLVTLIVAFYNPKVIGFGGGLTNILNINSLKKKMKSMMKPHYYKGLKIIKVKDPNAGAIGAALL